MGEIGVARPRTNPMSCNPETTTFSSILTAVNPVPNFNIEKS